MNRKKIIILIIASAAVLAAGYFYSFVKRDCALYNTDYSRSQMLPSVNIHEGNEFRYTFHCDKDNLTGIKVIISAVNADKPKGTITYRLFDGDGSRISDDFTMKFSRFKNGKFTFLNTDTIKNSAGKDFTLVISCDADEDNGVILSGQPDDGSVAVSYTYVMWDLETMIIFIIFAAYLAAFMTVLLKIFRK